MNILFWTDGFWPRIGGIETQAIQLIESMQERGRRYLVIAQKDHPEWLDEEIFRGISIVRFDFNKIINESRVTELDALQARIKIILANFKPEIIHLNTAIGNSAFLFLLLKKMFDMPVVLTLHSVCLDKNNINFITGKMIKTADSICCVSQSVLKLVQEHCTDNDGKKSVCIYNGLAFPETVPLPLDFHQPVLLCLGRLSPEKGFHYAIAAMAKLSEDIGSCRLMIAGDGPEREALVSLVRELKLEDKVSFIGAVKFSDVPRLINQAVIVLMPSTEESFGLVALEAAQMQRPVIAATVGGLPEVVMNNETGLLVPAKDVPALSQAIKLLLTNPGLTVNLGKNGRRRALNKFTISSVTAEYEWIYSRAYEQKQDHATAKDLT